VEKLIVAPAREEELPEILRIYASARRFMRESGNPRQWEEGYPSRELLLEDIRERRLFTLRNREEIAGVFVFFTGEEPTYRVIENGAWLSDAPYGTIHRIAGNGKTHGILRAALRYASGITGHLRIDTHGENLVMQRHLENEGFRYCGVIRVRGNSPRLAYERLGTEEEEDRQKKETR